MNDSLQNDRMRFFAQPLFQMLFRATLFSVFSIAINLFAEGPANAQAIENVIRISTELVGFEVTVTDKDGNPVKNLKSDEFRIFEMGEERPIDFFAPVTRRDEQRPLTVVFALDVSGSMTAAEIDKLSGAFRVFVDRLSDHESYFAVVTFSMDVRTVLPFTNRRDRIERSISRLSRNIQGLSTHAYDAADHAVRMIERNSPRSIRGRFPRRVVILITDGFPVGDIVSPQTVIERANSAETSIFAVLMPSFSKLQRDRRPLLTPLEASGLIARTGGAVIHATSEGYEPIFAAIAEEITSSYAIAFYPRDDRLEARGMRDVRIESKSGFTIKQNRAGYLRED